jgi:hypothetical protein
LDDHPQDVATATAPLYPCTTAIASSTQYWPSQHLP